MTAHNHFKSGNRSKVTAELYLPLFSPAFSVPPPTSTTGGHLEDHEVKQNHSATHITLCLPP